MRVVNGLVTVSVSNRPLVWVLDEISRRARIAVTRGEGIDEQSVTVEFKEFSPDEALREILKGYDAFFLYSAATAKQPSALRAVWVYRRGNGQRLAPIPPEMWASTRDVEEQLTSGEADERIAALEALIERRVGTAPEAAIRALGDVDERVRSRALYAARSGGVDLPPESLMQALGDSAASVRFLALEALSTGPSARAAAERAGSDPSPMVRQLAQEILKKFSAAPQRPNRDGAQVTNQR